MRAVLAGAAAIGTLLCACGTTPPPGNHPRAPSPALATPAEAEAALRDLAAHVDPAQGLVVVVRIEDASDGEAPPLLTSGQRCASGEIADVARLMADYVALRDRMQEPLAWSCVAERCACRGMMEYDPTRTLRFGRDGAGALVVTGLDLVDDLGAPPATVRQLRAQADAEHDALARGCR